MLEGYAEYYSIELAEKVKRGLTENALKAKANGGTCTFGYTVDSDRHYQIDPPAALIVREVFQLYVDGKTMKEIKDILNAKGLTNSRGKEFTFNTIQRMLSNRKYIGEYHFGEVTIPDSMPAIVDKELFEKVQQMLVKNKKAPSRHKAEDDYLLTTKLFCGHCGAIMNGESGTSHTNTTYRYYKCVNSRKKKCKKKPIAKEKIENAVIKRIMQFLEDEKAIDELVERIYELQFAENTYIPKLEEQIAETQKRIDNLIKAAEQGFVSESSARRLKELEETKKQQEIALIQEQIKTPLFTTDQIAFAIYKFRQLDLSTREAKQALIDGFVNAIYLYDDHAKLILNYKNDTKTITLDELQGSDFNSVTAPKHPNFGVFFCYCGGSILNFRYSERRELATDVTYRNTPDFGMRTYALFSFFAFSMSAPLISMIWSIISPALSTPWSNAFNSCRFINPPTLFTGAPPPDFLCAPTFLRLALLWA